MASKNNGFTKRLLEAIKMTGLENPEFAEKAKIGYSTLMNYLNPKNFGKVPEWDQLVKLAEATGKTIDWLLTGKEPPPSGSPTLHIQETPKFKTYHRDFSLNNYVPVRLLKDPVAAGSPAEIREWDVEGWALIYADKKWVPHDPEYYTCCRIRGDSMEEILKDGDIVAIDHAERNLNNLDNKIVAFRINGGATIKWLRKRPDGIYAIAENRNSDEPAIFFNHDEMNDAIIGKVAWWWAKR